MRIRLIPSVIPLEYGEDRAGLKKVKKNLCIPDNWFNLACNFIKTKVL